MSDLRRSIPSIDRLLLDPTFEELLSRRSRALIVSHLRRVQEELREEIARGVGEIPRAAEWYRERLLERLRAAEVRSLRGVINATGVVLHTNLGRAPLAPAAVEAMIEVASSYSNLEYDLEEGARGSRYDHAVALLCELSGAEDALVVNNNAAALVLALNTLSEAHRAVVSRGELVEIGGGFRVPEIMVRSGAELAEVGTTNRTHRSDYRRALEGGGVGALLKVHRSNFRIEGFTAEVGLEELVELAAPFGVPVINDLGSGLIDGLSDLGLPEEPTVREAVAAGADLVTLSGDKLLGGPQAGIIVGHSDLIAALRGNPLCRAFRVDKVTLAGLEATLILHRDPVRARREIPVLRMLAAQGVELEARAEGLARSIGELGVGVELVAGNSLIGGGAMPGAELPTTLVALEVPGMTGHELEEELRGGETPVIGRVIDRRLVLDPRTILEGEEEVLVQEVARIVRGQG